MTDIIFPLRTSSYAYFLYAMLAPKKCRLHVATILSFEQELMDIRHKVQEEMLAHIRFAWWRESLEALAAGQHLRHHPILDAMYALQAELHMLVPICLKRLEIQQHNYSEMVHRQPISDTECSLMEDIAQFVGSDKWYKKARIIRKYEQQHGLKGPKIGLLFRLMF